MAARSGIARRSAGGQLGLAGNLELERRAEARVDRPCALQQIEKASVHARTLRLAVRPAVVLAIRPRVPIDAQPPQVLHEGRGMGLAAALRICVLDAQNESPAGAPRQQEIK